jgi:membrane-associated phospholipid phosphatase
MGAVQMTTLQPAFWRSPGLERLLPGRLRRLAVILLLAWIAILVVLVLHFVGHGEPGSLDSAIDPPIMKYWRDSMLRHRLSDLGALGPVALLSLALAVACAVARRWSGAVLAAVAAPAATGFTGYVLRPYVGGPLGQIFPSKHAAGVFALAAVCVVLLASPPRQRLPNTFRLLLAFVALALAAAGAVSVVADGEHTFTDALAGAAVGTAVVLICTLLLDLTASRWSRFAVGQPATLTGDGPEARVWSFFHDYVDCGKPGYIYVLRHLGMSLGALIALFRLPCLQVAPSSANIEATTIRGFLSPQVTAFLSPRSILTRITGFATATLIVPREKGHYSLGASKQTLRRKVRRARRLGVCWAEVNDLQERHRLIKLAEEYEKVHPDETYRNAEPDLSWLLSHQLWLVAYSADDNPLLLSVTPVDGELAQLGHFRTIGFGEEQSDARYLMTEVLVEHLVDRGVRYLVDGGSLAKPNGIRHFQRMLGFHIVRIRVARSRPSRERRAAARD